jgi:N-acetylneuraminic acid mutarotase
VFDVATNTWRLLPDRRKDNSDTNPLPAKGKNCTLTFLNGYLYMFGGLEQVSRELYRYSLANEWWEHLPVEGFIPKSLSHSGAVIYDQHLFTFSGWYDPGDDDYDQMI